MLEVLHFVTMGKKPTFIDRRRPVLEITIYKAGLIETKVSKEASASWHSHIRANISGKMEQVSKKNPKKHELEVPNNYKSKDRLELTVERFEKAIKLIV